MQHCNIDTTPKVLYQAAELLRNYTFAQYQLLLNYYRAMHVLESEITTLGYQNVQEQILQMCKIARDHLHAGMQYASMLIQKADILESIADLHMDNVSASERTDGTILPTTPLRANQYAVTMQTITIRQAEDGTPVTVFDHPETSVQNAVYGQGYCMLGETRYAGTCGICATATILRKAGLPVNEQIVLATAVKHHLCDNTKDGERTDAYQWRGGTSPAHRSQIADFFTLSMEAKVEIPLEVLASKVEQGHGVIISVLAGEGFYNPNNMYSGNQGGHALVLDSVERDAATGKILAYYVIDSNGQTPDTAGLRIPTDTLKNAYLAQGARANITTEVIW